MRRIAIASAVTISLTLSAARADAWSAPKWQEHSNGTAPGDRGAAAAHEEWERKNLGFELSLDVGFVSMDASRLHFSWAHPATLENFGDTFSGHRVGLGRQEFVGPTAHLGFIIKNIATAGLELGVLPGVSPSVPFGQPSVVSGAPPVVISAGPGMIIQGGFRAGVVLPVFPFVFRASALFGARSMKTDVFSVDPATPTSASGSHGIVEPRAGLDFRFSDSLYVGVFAAADALHAGDWQCGIALRLSSIERAFLR